MTYDIDAFNRRGDGYLPGLIGLEVTSVEPGRLRARLELRPELMAPNGYLHAATVITVADTACGYGTRIDLPKEAKGFTTLELKANFLGTAREGAIECEAVRAHHGAGTQVWDAVVTAAAAGKTIALFRCTQFILR